MDPLFASNPDNKPKQDDDDDVANIDKTLPDNKMKSTKTTIKMRLFTRILIMMMMF